MRRLWMEAGTQMTFIGKLGYLGRMIMDLYLVSVIGFEAAFGEAACEHSGNLAFRSEIFQ